MKGILGKKAGMTSVYDNGKHTPVTVVPHIVPGPKGDVMMAAAPNTTTALV